MQWEAWEVIIWTVLPDEWPRKKPHGELTDRQTDTRVDEHCNSMTDPAHIKSTFFLLKLDLHCNLRNFRHASNTSADKPFKNEKVAVRLAFIMLPVLELPLISTSLFSNILSNNHTIWHSSGLILKEEIKKKISFVFVFAPGLHFGIQNYMILFIFLFNTRFEVMPNHLTLQPMVV